MRDNTIALAWILIQSQTEEDKEEHISDDQRFIGVKIISDSDSR